MTYIGSKCEILIIDDMLPEKKLSRKKKKQTRKALIKWYDKYKHTLKGEYNVKDNTTN